MKCLRGTLVRVPRYGSETPKLENSSFQATFGGRSCFIALAIYKPIKALEEGGAC